MIPGVELVMGKTKVEVKWRLCYMELSSLNYPEKTASYNTFVSTVMLEPPNKILASKLSLKINLVCLCPIVFGLQLLVFSASIGDAD